MGGNLQLSVTHLLHWNSLNRWPGALPIRMPMPQLQLGKRDDYTVEKATLNGNKSRTCTIHTQLGKYIVWLKKRSTLFNNWKTNILFPFQNKSNWRSHNAMHLFRNILYCTTRRTRNRKAPLKWDHNGLRSNYTRSQMGWMRILCGVVGGGGGGLGHVSFAGKDPASLPLCFWVLGFGFGIRVRVNEL